MILKTILKDYNPDVRPEEAHAEPLHVHFEIKLQKIVKLVNSTFYTLFHYRFAFIYDGAVNG